MHKLITRVSPYLSLQNTIILYLVLPTFIFLLYWTKAPISLMLVIILTVSLAVYFKSHRESGSKILTYKKKAITLALLITTAIFLTVVSGAGGYVVQRGDWTKHNVILNDLLSFDWPVYYGAGAYVKDTTLVYYLAYYLPPALIGKYLGGWEAVQMSTFIYTFLGILLFCIAILREKVKSWALPFFFLVSGIDVLGNIALGKVPLSLIHLESYAIGLQVPSFISQITWSPQHTISAWLFGYLMYRDIKSKCIADSLPLYAALCLLWSPFVSASIILVSIPFLWTCRINRKMVLTSIAGITLGMVMLLYFKSQINALNDHMTLYWTFQNSLTNSIFGMAVFLVVDILIFSPLLFVIRKKIDSVEYWLAVWCMILLVAVSQFRFGAANDWLLRTTPLFVVVITLVLLKNLKHIWNAGRYMRVYVVIVFLLGLFTAISQVIVLRDISNPATNERPDRSMMTAHLKYGVIHQQYMGSASRLFGKLIGNYEEYYK